MLKVLELFAGIGACSKALTNLGIKHEIVDAVEIDKFAIKSFNAIHDTNFEPQDITKWNKDIKVDLIMHGSPCQDFSVAGRNAGGDEGSGTRSSLLYETLRIVEKIQPDIVIWENVKNLLSRRHKHNFEAYLDRMSDMGYDSTAKVMNAKNYGVPQNRERVFTISIKRGSKLVKSYTHPEPRPLETKLKDLLEDNPDEKFYISDAMMDYFMGVNQTPSRFPRKERFLQNINRKDQDRANSITTNPGNRPTDNFVKIFGNLNRPGWHKENGTVLSPDGLATTIMAQSNNAIKKVAIKTANKKGYDIAKDGDGIDLAYPQSQTRRGRVGHEVAKTIPTNDSQGTLDGVRIRKLTPRECWRLMGFDDADFDKAQATGISNSQLYKQAGNSIVVNCLEAIINGIEWRIK